MQKFKLKMQGYIALLALLGISLHLIFRFLVPSMQAYALYPLYIILLVGGTPLVFILARKMFERQFSSDLLAGISIVTSVILQEYLAGSLVVLMLSGGETLENYAIRTASKVLEALAKRAPKIAHRKQGEAFEDIPTEDIAVGDTLVIFPHEVCPVDGEVIAGHGVMDESYLTGEPFRISKAPGTQVISGAINGQTPLTIRATKPASLSRYAQIIKVMHESEQKRPKMRRLADQLGAWYTPTALLIALSAWLISGEALRFLAVLVIATPCPLLLAIPVAIIGSISLAATRGIVIKDPLVLEQIDQCETMIFDKTGTLTYGKPFLAEEQLFIEKDRKEFLQLVASVERYSKHPLAGAVLNKAKEEKIPLIDAEEVRETPGEGLYGQIKGHQIQITSRKQLTTEQLAQLPEGGGLECIILLEGRLAAHFRFRDAPRADGKFFVRHLPIKHRIKKLMIISGDREEEVRYLADHVGITEIHASKSPEEKVQIVVKEVDQAKTVYLGDGINDAPALTAATVGIALGAHSDITIEAAGAVIIDSSLERVDELLHIGRRMRVIALQSAVGGMVLSILGMGIAAFGFLPPVAGAILQEIIDVFAILNSLRTIWRPLYLSDFPFKKTVNH